MRIVADIGGSHMRIAASDTPEQIEEPLVRDTPTDFDAAVATFATMAQEVARGRSISSGAVGVAGLFSPDRQTLLRAPHLRGWENKATADAFSQSLGAPVLLENDVALGALGEAQYGAGKGVSIVAYIAVGTGIGGARVTGGVLDRTAYGFEIGHQRLGVGADAPELEDLVSGSALERKYGRPASELIDPALWEECADNIAYGLYNSILHWSPERIVLGGSLFNKSAIPIERVRATLRTISSALPELPDIKCASLDDRSGLYGALALTNA